jgi:hypothetical protein
MPSTDGQYFAWSADGTHRAHADQQDTVVVSRPDGTVVSRTSLRAFPECEETPVCPFAVQAVSNDGRLVALGYGNTDPRHVTQAHTVLDTRTGQPVTLPQIAGDIDGIFFRPDGGLLLRSAGTYHVVGPDLKPIATVPEPPSVRGADLVAYRPS